MISDEMAYEIVLVMLVVLFAGCVIGLLIADAREFVELKPEEEEKEEDKKENNYVDNED